MEGLAVVGPDRGRIASDAFLLRWNAGSHGWFPSQNANALNKLGVLAPVREQDLIGAIEQFRQVGVPRFFAYVPPVQGLDSLHELLDEMGFRLCVEMAHLVHELDAAEQPDFNLAIRRADEDDLPILLFLLSQSGQLQEDWAQVWPQMILQEGVHVWLGFEGDAPVAMGALFVHQGFGYLGHAQTLASHRERGFQSALIRHRLATALSLGCDHVMSSTYAWAPHSFSNLIRAGFVHRYNALIYRYEFDPTLISGLAHTTEGHPPPE